MAPAQRPEHHTTRQLVDNIAYQQAGQPRTKLRGTPTLLLRAVGLTNPLMRELVEMQYEYEAPFIVDSAKITDKLGVRPTAVRQAIADTHAGDGPQPV